MPHTNDESYEFGPYRLNSEERVLTRAGETVGLTPKGYEILLMLVRNAGHALEKDHILREVWADTFVEDSNLTQNIFILRRALGDERSGPKYIETVPGRGYRFIANVRVCNADEPVTSEVDMADTSNGDTASRRIVVAVLPFVNATGDASLEYLAEGVTDNIINHLARVSQLRVMSRSAVFRHKKEELDPQTLGRELGANAVLVGTISSRPAGIAIGVELVDVAAGWQLWGESFDSTSNDLLEIHDAITRQLLVNLKLKLTGEEEKRVTARYTESAEAYQAYLEGRYHWSRYTRHGMEKAIGHFREAIELDPNYALAYAAIVDCYLRLATNYLPPEGDKPRSDDLALLVRSAEDETAMTSVSAESDINVTLRFEWDWKAAERELLRAHELKTDYPAAHQWYAAYVTSEQIYHSSTAPLSTVNPSQIRDRGTSKPVPIQIARLRPTLSERAQVSCTVAREQIDIGNYEAACKLLEPWWIFGNWPKRDGLNESSSADLLFTIGELAGCIASSKQLRQGQKHGEALLNGSIAIFEQLKATRRAAEARIELALCYYRQGAFDMARATLLTVLASLAPGDAELRCLGLIRLAALERHAGRPNEALTYLSKAGTWTDATGPWARGRYHLELASTYKDLAILQTNISHFETAEMLYSKARIEFQAIGNHRLTAIANNNFGLLFLVMGQFDEACVWLTAARDVFIHLGDRIHCAQVDDSLAWLHIGQGNLSEAQLAIDRSIGAMQAGDEDALLAESLATQGMIYCKLTRYHEAQQALEAAYRLSWRCGDVHGAARAVLIIAEEMRQILNSVDRHQIRAHLIDVLSHSPDGPVQLRIEHCLTLMHGMD